MPRFISNDDKMENYIVPGAGSIQFSGRRPDNTLGASEFTLVTIVLDTTGSVFKFAPQLLDTVKKIIEACKKSDRSRNLLVRYLTFSDTVQEVHGFKLLSEIDPNNYEALQPDGMTAVYDATYAGIGATLTYAKNLMDNEFNTNGAVYIITDGSDNVSKMQPSHIKAQMEEARMQEDTIESLITVLVALKDPKDKTSNWAQHVAKKLKMFKEEAELTQFVDVGEATPQKLAKLAEFVSESISSQSASLGKNGSTKTSKVSQNLTF